MQNYYNVFNYGIKGLESFRNNAKQKIDIIRFVDFQILWQLPIRIIVLENLDPLAAETILRNE